MSAALAPARERGSEQSRLSPDEAERIVLVAFAKGVFPRVAVAHLDVVETFRWALHRELFCIIESLFELRAAGVSVDPWRLEYRWDRTTRRRVAVLFGISVGALRHACRVCGLPEAVGYVRSLYAMTPRHADAERALLALQMRAATEEDAAAERRRSLRSLADLVPAELVALDEADLLEVLAGLRAQRSFLMQREAWQSEMRERVDARCTDG